MASGGDEDPEEGRGAAVGRTLLQTSGSKKDGAVEGRPLSKHLKVERNEPQQPPGGGVFWTKQHAGGRAGLMDATPEAETRGQKGVGIEGVEGIEGSELYPKGCGKLMQGFEGQKD